MPTDPLWTAVDIALALSVIALVVGCYAAVRGEATHDALHRLVDTLRRSGMPISTTNGVHREHATEAATAEAEPPATEATPTQAAQPTEAEDLGRVVAQPPQVRTPDGAVATGDWLQHYARPGVTWPGVVVEFYKRLEQIPVVDSYFYAADRPQVRGHFAGVAVKITRQGITVGDVETLRTVHAGVRNRRGQPITGEVYDLVINTLVAVLRDNGVPMSALQDLGRMLAEADLRSVLVVEPAHA